MKLLAHNNFNRKHIIVVAGLALVVGAAAVALVFSLVNKQPEGNPLDEDLSQIKAELDASLITETRAYGLEEQRNISASINEGDYETAVAYIRKLLIEPTIDSQSKGDLYLELLRACEALVDFDCLDEVVVHYESNDLADAWFFDRLAKLAVANDEPLRAQIFYTKAKIIIDDNGGQEYVDTINQGAEQGLDYQEITDGAR